MPRRLTASDLEARTDLADWQVLGEGIDASFRFASFTAAGEAVAAIAVLADEANHHPDLDLRYPGVVHVRLTSHDVGGLTERDTELAAAIAVLVSDRGAENPPSA